MNPLDEIVLSPAPVLTEECAPVEKIDDEIRALAKRMLGDMYAADGCGLAAPQVGVAKQVVVIDVDWSGKGSKKNPYVLINPKVITADGPERTTGEGCLSFPGIHADVPRSLAIRMRYMDEDFVEHDEEFHGLKAWVIQHEYDHIEGVVFTDRIAPLRRQLLKSKLLNLAKGKYRCAYKTR